MKNRARIADRRTTERRKEEEEEEAAAATATADADEAEEDTDSWRKNDDGALSKSGLTFWRKSSQRRCSSTLILWHEIGLFLTFQTFRFVCCCFGIKSSNRQGFLIYKVN